jgi:hypothetical protein
MRRATDTLLFAATQWPGSCSDGTREPRGNSEMMPRPAMGDDERLVLAWPRRGSSSLWKICARTEHRNWLAERQVGLASSVRRCVHAGPALPATPPGVTQLRSIRRPPTRGAQPCCEYGPAPLPHTVVAASFSEPNELHRTCDPSGVPHLPSLVDTHCARHTCHQSPWQTRGPGTQHRYIARQVLREAVPIKRLVNQHQHHVKLGRSCCPLLRDSSSNPVAGEAPEPHKHNEARPRCR